MTEAPFVFAPEFRGRNGEQGLPGPGAAAWLALDAVTTNAVRQAPDGSWIKSTTNRTTRATFDTTEAGFWTAVLGTSGTVEDKALKAAYLGYWPRGLDLTGAVDISTSVSAAFNAGERVHLKYGGPSQRDYLLAQPVNITGQPGGDIIFTADPGVRLIRTHTGRGIYQIPTASVASSPINAAAAGADHIQWTTSPGWTTDQWVGYEAQITFLGVTGLPVYDPAVTYQQGDQVSYDADGAGPGVALSYQSEIDNNVGNTPSPTSLLWSRLVAQTHTIVANSADTLYFADGLGALVGAGSTAVIMQPAANTVMTGWEMLCPNGGAAGVVLNWPGYIDLSYSVDGTTGGNPSTVYHAHGGHADIHARGGSILSFYYNCENVLMTGVVEGVTGVTNYHGVQLKDCRDCTAYDVRGKNLARVVDIKCSGLHPSRKCSIRGGTGTDISAIAFDVYTLLNEGKGYAVDGGSISGVKGIRCSTVARTYDVNDPAVGPRARGLEVGSVLALDSTGPALVVNAPKTKVLSAEIIGANAYAVALIKADYSTLDRVRIEQANRSSSSDMMRVTDTTGARVTGAMFDASTAGLTRRLVNETGTSTGNRYSECSMLDPTGQITQDYVLLGTSKAIRHPDLHPSTSTMISTAVDSQSRRFRAASDQTYTSNTTLASHPDIVAPLAKQGRYRFRLVVIADGDIGGDLAVAFTGPSGATLGYGTTTAPQASATATNNQSSRHEYKTSGALAPGLIGAGTKVNIVVEGEITVSSTAGNLQAQFAQVASSATATTVYTGSYLEITKTA